MLDRDVDVREWLFGSFSQSVIYTKQVMHNAKTKLDLINVRMSWKFETKYCNGIERTDMTRVTNKSFYYNTLTQK